MLSHGNQLDVFRDRAPTADEWRDAARAARQNPYETPDAAERRARYCEEQADMIERRK